MTTAIPEIKCRAKDPATCQYHSAQQRVEAAMRNGRWDDLVTAQQELAQAVRTSPEVLEFFKDFAQQKKAAPTKQPPAEAATQTTGQQPAVGAPPARLTPVELLPPPIKAQTFAQEVAGWDYSRKHDYLERLLINDPDLFRGIGHGYDSALLEDVIHSVASSNPRETVYDIVRRERHGQRVEQFFDQQPARAEMMRRLVAKWQDQPALKAQDLRKQPSGRPMDYLHADTLAKYGTVMDDNPTDSDWENWRYTRANSSRIGAKTFKVQAILSLQAETWEVFDQEDAQGNMLPFQRHGIAGEALLDDGTVRRLRYEQHDA